MKQPNQQTMVVVAGIKVRQDSEGRFNLNDLHKASGGERKNQPGNWSRTDTATELASEIYQSSDMRIEPWNRVVGGRNSGTYVCKELVYAYAMWISPRFHLQVIRAYDAQVTGQMPPAAQPNIPATTALCELAITVLRPSDSGKVVMLRKAGQAIGADTSFLPDYTEDSAPGHVGAMDTASLTQLLHDYGVRMSAAKFNQILREIGIIERRTRRTTNGDAKAFWCITDSGLDYGKNIVSPQSPRETQPHYYRDRFIDLLALAGMEAA